MARGESDGIPEALPVQHAPNDGTWRQSYTRLCNTSAKCLKACLQECNPVVFSEGNIKHGLCRIGQREVSPLVLSKYVTYVTDIREDILIKETDRNLEIMVAKCKAAYKPERTVDLLLPRDIENTEGLYSFIDRRAQNQGVFIKMTFEPHRGEKRVPRTFTGPTLFFLQNHSMQCALLCEKDGDMQWQCALSFAETELSKVEDLAVLPDDDREPPKTSPLEVPANPDEILESELRKVAKKAKKVKGIKAAPTTKVQLCVHRNEDTKLSYVLHQMPNIIITSSRSWRMPGSSPVKRPLHVRRQRDFPVALK